MFRNFTKFLILLLVLIGFFQNNALAASPQTAKPPKPQKKFPHGCRELGYEFQSSMLVLKPVSESPESSESTESEEIQTVYLIHNKALHPIYLMANRDPKDYTSPSHENIINDNQWGAFALNQPVLELKCSESEQNSFPVDCANVLELCQYNRAKFGSSMNGTYWVVQSTPLKEAVKHTIDAGIFLRW